MSGCFEWFRPTHTLWYISSHLHSAPKLIITLDFLCCWLYTVDLVSSSIVLNLTFFGAIISCTASCTTHCFFSSNKAWDVMLQFAPWLSFPYPEQIVLVPESIIIGIVSRHMGHSFYHHIWVQFQLLFNNSCNTFVLGSVMNSDFVMLSATFFWCFALVCQVVDFDYHDCIYTFVLHLYNSLRIAVAYQDWDDSMLSRRTICLVRRCTAFPFLFLLYDHESIAICINSISFVVFVVALSPAHELSSSILSSPSASSSLSIVPKTWCIYNIHTIFAALTALHVTSIDMHRW